MQPGSIAVVVVIVVIKKLRCIAATSLHICSRHICSLICNGRKKNKKKNKRHCRYLTPSWQNNARPLHRLDRFRQKSIGVAWVVARQIWLFRVCRHLRLSNISKRKVTATVNKITTNKDTIKDEKIVWMYVSVVRKQTKQSKQCRLVFVWARGRGRGGDSGGRRVADGWRIGHWTSRRGGAIITQASTSWPQLQASLRHRWWPRIERRRAGWRWDTAGVGVGDTHV